jgi:DNA-binding protein H-NS
MPVVSAYNHENVMRKLDLAAMQFEDLWQLYEELANVLADRISAEKDELEDRLAKLNSFETVREVRTSPPLSLSSTDRALRRKYPKVLPKYRNPLAPSQEWSGRGKRPKWVIAALEAGQRLDDLKIERAQKGRRKSRPRDRSN